MGKNFRFDAHCNSMEFDRNTQKPMLGQEKLEKWAIFYGRNSQKEANTLRQEFDKVMQGFDYPAKLPALFQVEGDDRKFSTWENLFKK